LRQENANTVRHVESATIQDGGGSKSTNRYVRPLVYDVSNRFHVENQEGHLIGEWVVPLPQGSKGFTFAQSEIHSVKKNVWLEMGNERCPAVF